MDTNIMFITSLHHILLSCFTLHFIASCSAVPLYTTPEACYNMEHNISATI